MISAGPEVSFSFLERLKINNLSRSLFLLSPCKTWNRGSVVSHRATLSTHPFSWIQKSQTCTSAADNRFIICLGTHDHLMCILQLWESRCSFWQLTSVENLCRGTSAVVRVALAELTYASTSYLSTASSNKWQCCSVRISLYEQRCWIMIWCCRCSSNSAEASGVHWWSRLLVSCHLWWIICFEVKFRF